MLSAEEFVRYLSKCLPESTVAYYGRAVVTQVLGELAPPQIVHVCKEVSQNGRVWWWVASARKDTNLVPRDAFDRYVCFLESHDGNQN